MQTGQRIAVVLADDHVVVRRGLRIVLERVPGFAVVGEAGDVVAALDAVAAEQPDVVVLDLNMPGRPPLDALSEFADAAPDVGVVVLTMEQDPDLARLAIDRGARGYVLKQAVEEELIDAIRIVASDGAYVSREIDAALTGPAKSGRARNQLTERETEVLRLIALGHTNADAAKELSLSIRTVETHRTRIQQKLGASTRPELVRFALAQRLI